MAPVVNVSLHQSGYMVPVHCVQASSVRSITSLRLKHKHIQTKTNEALQVCKGDTTWQLVGNEDREYNVCISPDIGDMSLNSCEVVWTLETWRDRDSPTDRACSGVEVAVATICCVG